MGLKMYEVQKGAGGLKNVIFCMHNILMGPNNVAGKLIGFRHNWNSNARGAYIESCLSLHGKNSV